MKFLNYKVLFYIVLVVAILEGIQIKYSSDSANIVNMPSYSFSDSVGGLVTARGSWVSTTSLAMPLQSVQIDCWKDFNYCWISDGTLYDNFLSTGLNLHEIAYWNDDFIETAPSQSMAGCVEETYRLDRRSKTVTYTRKTVNNKTGLCQGVQDEPIISKLGSGMERIDMYKKNK